MSDGFRTIGTWVANAPETVLEAIAESDPNGRDPHTPGSKLDNGKPRVGLVMSGFANALLEVSRVGTFGAKKYTDDGWLSVPDGQARYEDALLRHTLYATMDDTDPDSGLTHLGHRAWCALAVLELYLRDRKTE